MIKRLTFTITFFSALSVSGMAQDANRPAFPSAGNAVHIVVSGIINDSYAVMYERALNDYFSAGAGFTYSPNYAWGSKETIWAIDASARFYFSRPWYNLFSHADAEDLDWVLGGAVERQHVVVLARGRTRQGLEAGQVLVDREQLGLLVRPRERGLTANATSRAVTRVRLSHRHCPCRVF